MDTAQRIAQFEHMAGADPDNDMAHFSLAGAYAQAERWPEAAAAYLRCVEVNPDMSKARQLAGEALAKAGDEEKAKAVLAEGYVEAAKRGDRLPQRAMAERLEALGAEVPELDAEVEREAERLAAAQPGGFVCARTGRPGAQLPRPPFRGPVGSWIHEHISAETWRTWIGQGTKVINELRLDMSRGEDQDAYDKHMHEFLGIDDALLEKLRSESPSNA